MRIACEPANRPLACEAQLGCEVRMVCASTSRCWPTAAPRGANLVSRGVPQQPTLNNAAFDHRGRPSEPATPCQDSTSCSAASSERGIQCGTATDPPSSYVGLRRVARHRSHDRCSSSRRSSSSITTTSAAICGARDRRSNLATSLRTSPCCTHSWSCTSTTRLSPLHLICTY